MSNLVPIRAVLMAAEIRDGGTGFHRLVFKVDGGRTGMFSTTVLISQDACRKLTAQMQRAKVHRLDRASLLKNWARWEIAQRMDESGGMPETVTITASDLDDYGAYAMDLARSLAVG